MIVLELADADREVLRGILLAQRAEGAAVPLIPLDVDLDGDGKVDAWGLDPDDQVVLVSGVDLEFTSYASDGDDVIEHDPDPDHG